MSPLSADQVLGLFRSHQRAWRQRYQLQRIGLFGSTARNEAKAGSDVDVWVEPVTARKDDASAAHQAALTKVAGWGSCSGGGGLIHTTSG